MTRHRRTVLRQHAQDGEAGAAVVMATILVVIATARRGQTEVYDTLEEYYNTNLS